MSDSPRITSEEIEDAVNFASRAAKAMVDAAIAGTDVREALKAEIRASREECIKNGRRHGLRLGALTGYGDPGDELLERFSRTARDITIADVLFPLRPLTPADHVEAFTSFRAWALEIADEVVREMDG